MFNIITDINKLRMLSRKVTEDENIDYIIKEMKEIVSQDNVLGLAAPQIGFLKRIIMVKIDKNILPLINPSISINFNKNLDINYEFECCLSCPNEIIEVPCENEFDLIFFNEKFEKKFITVKNELARIINHEIRHLDGKLIIDYKNN